MRATPRRKGRRAGKGPRELPKGTTAYADRAAAEANVSKYEQALAELKDSTGDTSGASGPHRRARKVERGARERRSRTDRRRAGRRELATAVKQGKEIELNETNEAISENDKYLDEAKKSTDGCATSIDKFGNKVKDSKRWNNPACRRPWPRRASLRA